MKIYANPAIAERYDLEGVVTWDSLRHALEMEDSFRQELRAVIRHHQVVDIEEEEDEDLMVEEEEDENLMVEEDEDEDLYDIFN